ncbi:RNA 2',3'-cyclic phosphodiesterase [Clostridium cellulovorans]|uniref:RNA 2',3'-cyclic phosphodiesterase n=1 Tax=Clostridium cellulovorans (strain ATCC 35296 / DSM 3052 / OCM 3 / 743B) TaxID=573061 RepID=D9SSN9_CLOC7|nr:RNA 2',3'-cyclic phosphodiesterase [Clostridium cellulovorans]ADL50636.1 2'-5' RNA ligase [Clostridium cellulovorans 743B]
MRVYIAIAFEDTVEDYFDKITSSIKEHCTEGSFTRKNNFHLTVRFIGEVDDSQIDRLKEVLDKSVLKITPFELLVNNLGVFKRKNTNILWIGAEESPILSELHKELSILLQEYKIAFYDKRFMPHITLGRRVVFQENSKDLNDLIQFERIKIPVEAITLMASKEENGKLNGVPLYKVNLK